MLWLDRPGRVHAIRPCARWLSSHYASTPSKCCCRRLQGSPRNRPSNDAPTFRPHVRRFTTSPLAASSLRHDAHLHASVESTSGGIHINQIGPQIVTSGGVRDYLREWSTKYQKDQKENAPSEVTLGRNTLLPNSLFVRDTVDTTPVDDDDQGTFQQDAEYDGDVALNTYQLVPGDVFLMATVKIKTQFALYLGHVGAQGQYLLADGRWYMSVRSIYPAIIIHDFATDQEMAAVRAYLPTKPVEIAHAGGGGQTFARAFGEVPFEASSAILSRFAVLSEEGEDFKRDHARALELLYDNAASETEVTRLSLQQLVRQQLNMDFDTLNDGSKVVLLAKLWDESRLAVASSKQHFALIILPKHMTRGARDVTEWARAYQDAAARAASGKDVSQDLHKNPLTNFISKARRIITQSRKIRTPTAEGQLGPTKKSALNMAGGSIRKSTGEHFDENEKKIVLFLWTTYALVPFRLSPANKRNTSICSIILRAIGAYPKYNLNADIGRLFLQELGCIDPWVPSQEHNAALPLNWLGLNESARTANDKQEAAMAQLNIPPGSKQPPFPDSMAHLRKDWGDLEVFCVDSKSTRVVDDGISVEPSKEAPGHYWLHTHIAHPSAFIPVDHPLHEKMFLMGGTAYAYHGAEQCYPHRLTDTFSVQPDGPVLTVSTLLALDGAVKDVQVVPGIVRNVKHLNVTMLEKTLGLVEPVVQELVVGPDISLGDHRMNPSREDIHTDDYTIQQQSLISTHLKTFELIRNLVVARWEARQRENPDYLKMRKLSWASADVVVQLPEPPDLSYQRIFRSEHCYGDPWIRARSSKANFHETYDEQPRKYHPVAGAMLLAAESLGAWARPRGIPALYRYQSFRPGFDLNKLNNLGPHEGYLSLVSGESSSPSPYPMLNMAQMMPCSSPLRLAKDLINQYQIDAYLKAEAATPVSDRSTGMQVDYPRTRVELLRYLREEPDYKDLRMADERGKRHWKIMALFRALHFGEAQLPQTCDVQVGNPVRIGKEKDTITATLMLFELSAVLMPSEQGWEKHAKFRQFLPVKIQSVDVTNGHVICVAVGPPTDIPRIKDFAYPELLPRSEEAALGQHAQ